MSSPTRVLMNDRVLWQSATGIGHYIAQLSRELPKVAPDVRLLTPVQALRRPRSTLPRSHDPAARAQGSTSTGPSRRRPPAWIRESALAAYDTAFRLAGRAARCRVYHEPNHIPVRWSGPILTTVHDLSALRNPSWHPADRVRWYERELLAGVRRTTHFVAASKFTRDEMIDLLGIPVARITVIYQASRHAFQPRPPDAVSAWLAERGWPARYVLFVGTLEPRKNLPSTLKAYASLPLDLRREYPLVIVGKTGWGDQRLQNLAGALNIRDQLRFTGYLDDESLAWLCAGARVLVWPSLYEGFGLPVLECMACGTPVISSRRGATAEIVGDAGLLIEPTDESQIANALQRIIEDDALAANLAAKGFDRAATFSWTACAAEHAALYRMLATTR